MKRYEAKWDTMARALTALVFLILLTTAVYYLRKPANSEYLYGVIILVVAILITWLSSPSYYATDAEGVHVHRRGGSLDIPYHKVKKITRIYRGELGWGLRLFGSGGLFGYTGIFWYGGSVGKVNMNCTDRNSMVLIETGKAKIMVSPDDADAFVEEVTQRMG